MKELAEALASYLRGATAASEAMHPIAAVPAALPEELAWPATMPGNQMPTQASVPPPSLHAPGSQVRVRWTWIAGLAGGGLVLVIVVIVLLGRGGRDAPPRRLMDSAGLADVKAARSAYEAELKKHDPRQLALNAPVAWNKLVTAQNAAEKAAQEGRPAEAVDQYAEARTLLVEAVQQAQWPEIKTLACGGGHQLGAWIMAHILAPTATSAEQKKTIQEYIEDSRPRLRLKLESLKVPAKFIERTLAEKDWTAGQALYYQQRLADQVSSALGKPAGASFMVGVQLAWLQAGLGVENKKPGSFEKETLLKRFSEARTAAYLAGHPQEMIDALARVQSLYLDGATAKANKLIEQFIDKVIAHESGVTFFRQPPAVQPRENMK